MGEQHRPPAWPYWVKCTWGDVYVFAMNEEDAIQTARATWGRTYVACKGLVDPLTLPKDEKGWLRGVGQVTEARQKWNHERTQAWLAGKEEG